MDTTLILTDTKNDIGKIYLICNRTHGYYTLLPLVNVSFITFLEKLYTAIDVDDYEINFKYLVETSLQTKIIEYLHNIFNSNTLTFAINNIINTSNDFFIYLNQLLVNHIFNVSLLKNFKLLENSMNTDDKISIKPQVKNNFDDIRYQFNKSTRIQNNLDYNSQIIQNSNIDKNDIQNMVKHTEKVLPYNHYELNSIDNKTSIIPLCRNMLTQYYSWEGDESTKNKDNLNKCSILYCISLSIGIVIENEDTIFVDYLIKNFKDFELLKNYNNIDKKELDNMKNYFHKKNFESNEILCKKISSFESLYDINSDKKNNEIEEFIQERYNLNNDPKNMMKANEILKSISLELQYSNNEDKIKLSKELSCILLNIGLKKKRMADGIYYYGIVPKSSLINTSDTIDDKFKKSVEEHKLNSVSENIDTSITLQSGSIKS